MILKKTKNICANVCVFTTLGEVIQKLPESIQLQVEQKAGIYLVSLTTLKIKEKFREFGTSDLFCVQKFRFTFSLLLEAVFNPYVFVFNLSLFNFIL